MRNPTPTLAFARRGVALALAALLAAGCPLGSAPPERLPRFEPPQDPAPRVALVLGSGGPRGFAHVGVLKVLEEIGVRPDLIVGASVGALVGVLYASGLGAAELERTAVGINVLRFLDLRQAFGRPGTGESLQRYVDDALDGRTLEALRVPVAITATRLRDERLVVFNHGDPGLAVRASSADPGNFAPVAFGGETYIDGDAMSPVPIRVARDLGARFVIAVDVSAHAASTPPGVPREWVEKDARRAAQVAAEAPLADVLLHPDIGYYAGYDEDYRRRVIAAAEAHARARLPQLCAKLAAAGIATRRGACP